MVFTHCHLTLFISYYFVNAFCDLVFHCDWDFCLFVFFFVVVWFFVVVIVVFFFF